MNELNNSQINKRTDGETDRLADVQTIRETPQINMWTDGNRQTNKRTYRQTDKQTDVQTNRQTHGQTHRQTDGWDGWRQAD